MILVDTSVWIDWLRRGNRPATRVLDRLIDEDDIVLAAVVLQELLQGARGEQQLAELRVSFDKMPAFLPTEKHTPIPVRCTHAAVGQESLRAARTTA